MKLINALAAFCIVAFSGIGNTKADDTPDTEFVMELIVSLGETFKIGDCGSGERIVVPITGGVFSGPDIEGVIIDGGADYQLYDKAHNRNRLEAIYCLKTNDGEFIRVQNCGIAAGDYFFTTPTFEASFDGKYAWLNDAVFICRPSGFADNVIRLKVWKVK